MARLTPEELAQLTLIKETLVEMYDEVADMFHPDTAELENKLIWARLKCQVILARHGQDIEYDPPPLSNIDGKYPF